MRGVIAGSFDPFTVGHLELLKKAIEMFGSARILINADSNTKKYKASLEVRAGILYRSIPAELINKVTVEAIGGLLPDMLEDGDILVRGIRDTMDYNYEHSLLMHYRAVSNKPVEACYLMPEKFGHVSSSFVRELVLYGRRDLWEEYVAKKTVDDIQKFYS